MDIGSSTDSPNAKSQSWRLLGKRKKNNKNKSASRQDIHLAITKFAVGSFQKYGCKTTRFLLRNATTICSTAICWTSLRRYALLLFFVIWVDLLDVKRIFFFTFFYKKWSIPGVFSAQPPTEWTMGAGDNLWCSHPCTWPVIIHTTCTQRHYMQFSRTHSFIKVCTKVTDNETNFGKALRYRICARWDCRNLNEILTNMLVFEGYLDNPKSAKTST